MHFSRFFYLFVLLGATVSAQSIHWEPASGRLSFNQVNELQLIFDDCEPSEDPAVPTVPHLQLQSVGSSTSMSVTNGHISQSVVITVHVRATDRPSVTIPAFSVKTNKGTLEVPAATYQVADATVGQSNTSLQDVANSQIEVPKEVWAGEVFKLEYNLSVIRRYLYSPNGSQPEWNSAPLTVEDWAKPDLFETAVNGERKVVISYKTRALAKQPGEITLQAATQVVNLATGTTSFGLFAQPNLQPFSITSSRPTITVRPLPLGAPESFKGAVGHFTFESKVVPTSGQVGEPITWTLSLAGNGNWPEINGLPTRAVSRGFRVVQPHARRAIKEGSLFDGTLSEDVILIPTQPGTYTLGPISWSYFDPTKGAYETVKTPLVEVTVSAAALQPPAPNNPAAGASATDPGEAGKTAHVVSAPPSSIPRDPLPGPGLAAVPWSQKTFLLVMFSPIPLLLSFWLGLAWRRARATDPNRIQREAAVRLKNLLTDFPSLKDTPKVHRQLQAWQKETALVWRIAPAVPKPADFVANSPSNSAEAKIWAELWLESEKVLYRPSDSLSTDWVKKAQAAIDAKRLPTFSLFQLFEVKNLLPFAALWLLSGLLLPHLAAVEIDPTSRYRSGDFAAAQSGWQNQAKAQPNDWAARYNLSLALEQQSRWSEASAHAIAAFVQHPSDPAIRWNLNFSVEHAGFEPGFVAGFVSESPTHSLARLFSPAEWQRVMLAAAFVAALGLALVLLRYYAPFGAWCMYVGFATAALAIAGIFLGALAINRYQESGDKHCAIIWKPSLLRSIPTEVDATQKTSTLTPGSVAVVDKTFLTWTRLSFSNGQTGWVREEDLIRIWE